MIIGWLNESNKVFNKTKNYLLLIVKVKVLDVSRKDHVSNAKLLGIVVKDFGKANVSILKGCD